MASQHPNPGGQNQMMRDSMVNHPSDVHSQAQNPNFLQETGSHLGSMAHGATEIGKGAFLGAASLASGAAQGVSNVASGTAGAIKNTFGLGTTESAAHSTGNINMQDESNYPNRPSYPHAP